MVAAEVFAMAREDTPGGDAPRKGNRLYIRIADDDKALLEEAAAHSGVSVSEFIVREATIAAEQELASRTRFVLPPDKWEEFVTELERPARFIPELARLMEYPDVFDD